MPRDLGGYFTEEEYEAAYQEAEKKIGVAHKERHGFRMYTRTMEVLWLKRFLGSTYGTPSTLVYPEFAREREH